MIIGYMQQFTNVCPQNFVNVVIFICLLLSTIFSNVQSLSSLSMSTTISKNDPFIQYKRIQIRILKLNICIIYVLKI
jgi:hypothetical protein